MVRDIVLHLLTREEYLALHASTAVIGGKGIATLGRKRAGKTTLLMHMLERCGSAYLSNDKVLAKATGPGVTVHGIPLSCMVGVGTMRSIPALRRHLHYWEHFHERTASQEELWNPIKRLSSRRPTFARSWVAPYLSPRR
jgi:hypothetical protein